MREIIVKVLKEQVNGDRALRMGQLDKSTIRKLTSQGLTIYYYDNKTISLVQVSEGVNQSDWDGSKPGKFVFALTKEEYEIVNRAIDKVKKLIELKERQLKIFRNEYIPSVITKIIENKSSEK